jgi:S1-C subfamily serine protease
LLIREIAPESPAAKAGLKEGDLIVGAGDRPIVTADDLYAALDAADDTLQVKILRGAEDGILDLTL